MPNTSSCFLSLLFFVSLLSISLSLYLFFRLNQRAGEFGDEARLDSHEGEVGFGVRTV